MKILVTGARGFIGSHAADELLSHGHQVRAMDLTPVGEDQRPGLEHIRGDITKREDCRQALRDCQVVLHLAAKVSDWGATRDFFRVNVDGTECLLRAAAEAGVQRFVLVSSVAVHHYRGLLDADESTPCDGNINAYCSSKIAAEELLRSSAGSLEWTIVRPGVFPFGPRDRTSFLDLARAMERGALGYVNRGQALVTTAYVENLALGLRLAAEHPAAANQVFVVGDPERVSWRELFTAMAQELGVAPPRLSLPEVLAYPLAWTMEAAWRLARSRTPPPLTRYRILLSPRDCHFSSAKAQRLLGYTPRVGLEEGIRRTVAWYRSQS